MNKVIYSLKVTLVSVEQGISALGFRRMAAVARTLNPITDICFITVGNVYSLATHLFPSRQAILGDTDIEVIANHLAEAHLLCFSSMTPCAPHVERIVRAVKQRNPQVFILWGGVHCIIHPETAIQHVDAICTGEGEIPFMVFYEAFRRSSDYLSTPSMWFNTERGIIKNQNCALNSHLESFPHMFADLTCQIYDSQHKEFRSFNHRDYLRFNGASYRTVWSIGCPYSCIYCANDVFITKDSNYRKLRFSPVNYLLEEISSAIRLYPYISTIVFYDDNFILIPTEVLRVFSTEYKRQINLPFVVFGLHPNIVTEEKLTLLGEAGMNRGRMGIQSGSERILSFYRSPTPLAGIKRSAKILAAAAKKYDMIPPSYDVISDNPLESREDMLQTMHTLYELDRPYTLTIFSLRVFPNTRLWEYFGAHPEIDIRDQTSPYLETRKTMTNILLYVLAIFKPPKWLFSLLCRRVRGYQEQQRAHPFLFFIVKSIYLSSRGIEHLRRLDSTAIVGPWRYYFWKWGLLKSNRCASKTRGTKDVA